MIPYVQQLNYVPWNISFNTKKQQQKKILFANKKSNSDWKIRG